LFWTPVNRIQIQLCQVSEGASVKKSRDLEGRRLEKKKAAAERRMKRREEVAAKARAEIEARAAAREAIRAEYRRQHSGEPMVYEIWSRGWGKPIGLTFSPTPIPVEPEEMENLTVEEVKKRMVEAEAKAAERKCDDDVADVVLGALNQARRHGRVSDDESN